MELETERLKIIALDALLLKLFCSEDGQAALERRLALAVTGGAARDAHLSEAYREMYEGLLSHPAEYLWRTVWLTVLKSENRIIGSAAFFGAPDENGRAMLGYGIDEEFCGRGFCTEAVFRLCRWAFESGASAVCAETEPDNAASRRVLEKCGFRLIGEGEVTLYEKQSEVSLHGF